MPAVGLTEADHSRVFGPRDDLDAGVGRSKLCKVCGGWHKLDRWPHNCMEPQDMPPQRLASPMLAPTFHSFMTGKTDTAEYIGSRNDKREFMNRNDLVEYDAGVVPDRAPTEREKTADIVADIKRFAETAPENIPPDLKVQEHVGDLAKSSDSPDIDTSNMEIIA